MKTYIKNIFYLFTIALMFNSCVSVDLYAILNRMGRDDDKNTYDIKHQWMIDNKSDKKLIVELFFNNSYIAKWKLLYN